MFTQRTIHTARQAFHRAMPTLRRTYATASSPSGRKWTGAAGLATIAARFYHGPIQAEAAKPAKPTKTSVVPAMTTTSVAGVKGGIERTFIAIKVLVV
ncbi:hypothetical protein HK104_002906 [Borealophlyctis nickersoniae]|nr:hypothetical protein HK104_002906 [Borealophlyctis nickersoniae]